MQFFQMFFSNFLWNETTDFPTRSTVACGLVTHFVHHSSWLSATRQLCFLLCPYIHTTCFSPVYIRINTSCTSQQIYMSINFALTALIAVTFILSYYTSNGINIEWIYILIWGKTVRILNWGQLVIYQNTSVIPVSNLLLILHIYVVLCILIAVKS